MLSFEYKQFKQVLIGGGNWNEITLLKCIATFLITWFHFKWSVPAQYQALFIGGAIGNSLFFYCSGYLLKFTDERNAGEWLWHKYKRIMPSVWSFTILMMLCGSQIYWYNYIYPTQWWFVNSILCYFLIAYILRNKLISWKRPILVAIPLFQFLYYYLFVDCQGKIVMDEGGFKCWFFFFFFLCGFYNRVEGKTFKFKKSSLILLPLSIALFFAYKKAAPSYESVIDLQIIAIPLLLMSIVCQFKNFVPSLLNLSYPTKLKTFLIIISNLTLDIYIVQVFLINRLMPRMSFPINIAVTFIIVVVAAFVNKYLSYRISKLM